MSHYNKAPFTSRQSVDMHQECISVGREHNTSGGGGIKEKNIHRECVIILISLFPPQVLAYIQLPIQDTFR